MRWNNIFFREVKLFFFEDPSDGYLMNIEESWLKLVFCDKNSRNIMIEIFFGIRKMVELGKGWGCSSENIVNVLDFTWTRENGAIASERT